MISTPWRTWKGAKHNIGVPKKKKVLRARLFAWNWILRKMYSLKEKCSPTSNLICSPALWGPLELTTGQCGPFHTLNLPWFEARSNFTHIKPLCIVGLNLKRLKNHWTLWLLNQGWGWSDGADLFVDPYSYGDLPKYPTSLSPPLIGRHLSGPHELDCILLVGEHPNESRGDVNWMPSSHSSKSNSKKVGVSHLYLPFISFARWLFNNFLLGTHLPWVFRNSILGKHRP